MPIIKAASLEFCRCCHGVKLDNNHLPLKAHNAFRRAFLNGLQTQSFTIWPGQGLPVVPEYDWDEFHEYHGHPFQSVKMLQVATEIINEGHLMMFPSAKTFFNAMDQSETDLFFDRGADDNWNQCKFSYKYCSKYDYKTVRGQIYY